MKYVSADCGSGKTKRIIEISNSNFKRNIIVQSTSSLIQQTMKNLKDADCILSGLNSTNTIKSFSEWLRCPTSRNLVLTNKTFFRASEQDIEIMSNSDFVIHIDDVTTGHNFFYGNTKHSEIIEEMLEQHDSTEEYFTSVELKNSTEDLVINSIYSKIVESGISDYVVMKNPRFDTEGEMKKISILSSIDLSKYLNLDITFYANDFENSLLYKSHPEMFNKVSLTGLNERLVPIKDRMRVHYFSETNLSKFYKDNNPEYIMTVLNYIEQNVENFIYTSNKSDGISFSNGEFVSVDCRGINSYQSYTNCVFLASLKPNKNESEMTDKFLNISYSDIVHQRELEALYQFVNRTALRNYDSTTIVNVYVFDKQQAQRLSDDPILIDVGINTKKDRKKTKVSLKDKFGEALLKRIRRFIKTCNTQSELNNFVLNYDWTEDMISDVQKLFDKK